MTVSIYAHFPFCLRKCPYCDFVSYDSVNIDHGDYVEAMLRELAGSAALSDSRPVVSTIYLGGGTPSLMTPVLIDEFLSVLRDICRILDGVEITIEVNPATADMDDMRAWRSSGVNRVSLGLQSTDDGTLRKLGRVHNCNEGIQSYENARRAGFDSVSVDLIFGVPGQDLETWRMDLEKAIDLRPDHVSAYILKPPSGWESPSEDTLSKMYIETVKALERAGIRQYEVSNFSKPGFESRHNLNYWNKGGYIGLGVAAHSYARLSCAYFREYRQHPVPTGSVAARWWNVTGPVEYISLINEKDRAVSGIEFIDPDQDAAEAIMLSLRTKKGLDTTTLPSKYRITIENRLPQLVESGLAEIESSRIVLTTDGMLLADEIASELVAEK